MLCARYKRDDCLRILIVSVGADLCLVSSGGISAAKGLCFQPLERQLPTHSSANLTIYTYYIYASELGHVNVFHVLVFAGAIVKLCNKAGGTTIDLSRSNENWDVGDDA
ncbi:ankyrin repeat domain-containing protein 17-like [Canna indica]|uniref:Ankyrin repeat domain-containing protein 17-like n=1 Tax=Canna indica TaxID=4628 RepID=A0AAQ3JWG2_9LILI|nr:ankyrin repeat domain-containing protein 17-like [Canna indica]